MNITRGQAQSLGRKQQRPVRGPDDLIAVFVAGRLTNPMNELQSAPWFAGKHARYKRQWKERIAQALFEAGWRRRPRDAFGAICLPSGLGEMVFRDARKVIHFHATVPKKFDGIDGLRAAMKAFPDALKECGVVQDDRDSAGHVWEYHQTASRKLPAGVEIRVRLREEQ